MSGVQKLEKSKEKVIFVCSDKVVCFHKCRVLWCERFLTCWFSVFIEKAEMSNRVPKINPNNVRIHMICKQAKNKIVETKSWNSFSVHPTKQTGERTKKYKTFSSRQTCHNIPEAHKILSQVFIQLCSVFLLQNSANSIPQVVFILIWKFLLRFYPSP